MALTLKGLPQISQDGQFVWFTDKTGEYAAVSNETGWGDPNFELNQSALLLFAYRMEAEKKLLVPVGSAIKHSAAAGNETELVFQLEYLQDGHTQFNMLRLMVSANDVSSIDTTPVVFTDGDVWYNSSDGLVKTMIGAAPVEVDITDPDTLDALLGLDSVVELLCEDIYYKNLATEKEQSVHVDARIQTEE